MGSISPRAGARGFHQLQKGDFYSHVIWVGAYTESNEG